MNRQSYIVRAARLVQDLPLSCLRPLETPFVKLHPSQSTPPKMLILLGLPRSGSTLAYQILIHGLGALYLSNLWNLLYALPFFGGKLSARVCGIRNSNFKSEHGFVPGRCGPAEGLRFWSYWFENNLDDRVQRQISDDKHIRRIAYIKQALGRLTTASKPMVTGYLGHTLATQQLRECFPDAIFIRLHRDPIANANSIFQIRRQSQSEWFSVFPKECMTAINTPLHTQIASQVYWLNRRLDAIANKDRTVHISYEHLCTNPNAELQKIVDFANDRGYELRQKQTLPDAFAQRERNDEDREHLQKILDAMRLLEKEHGQLDSRSRFGY